jgi:hypothetical protein
VRQRKPTRSLPADIQEITVFSTGLHKAASAPEAAQALVEFLTAPAAVHIEGRRRVEINNPQQSWGFEWEPPKSVMKDSGTRDWTADICDTRSTSSGVR